MDTNTENLVAAAAFWAGQATSTEEETFVVATQTTSRVLANNTSVMLAGVDQPMKFLRWEEASWQANKLNVELRGPARHEQFYICAYSDFCLRLAALFRAAVQTATMADMLARKMGAA